MSGSILGAIHCRFAVFGHALASVLFFASAGIAQAGQELRPEWTPALALEVKKVDDVVPSPDGRLVAFAVSEAVMEDERSEWVSQIHVGSADGRRSTQLTRHPAGSSGPAWTPDGRSIVFRSGRDGHTDLWRIPVDGGEAERLTRLSSHAGYFELSPDGARVAFVTTDPPSESRQEASRTRDDARVFGEDLQYARLWVMELGGETSASGTPRRLTSGEHHVGALFGRPFSWSPDGREIAFAHLPVPGAGQWTEANVSIVDVETGAVRALANTDAAESGPVWSPGGDHIAVSVSDDPPSWGFTSRIRLFSPDGAISRDLAPSYDERPDVVGWTADGRRLLVSEAYRTTRRLFYLPVDGSEVEAVSPDGFMVVSPRLNHDGSHLGFVSESPAEAPEAYATSVRRFRPARVSSVQELPPAPLGETEVVQWTSGDGTAVEGLLTYPVGWTGGEPVPLLVVVHGGPQGVFTREFTGRSGVYPTAAFAERGYAVLRPNIRGSSGYGRDFRFANYQDWGGGDYEDLMSGVDMLVERGVADPGRLGIMGWSYGGYMTAWVITQTDRFAAASVGAALPNLVSFAGTSDIPGFIPDYFRGEHWQARDLWLARSPIFQAGDVATPALIQHGEADNRVPVGQAYEFYHTLDRQGTPTRLVLYPRQGHNIREPKLEFDAMRRNLDWFERWIGAADGP